MATGIQRSAPQKGVFPGSKGKRWGGGRGEGFRGAKSRQCAQEETNGMYFYGVAFFTWAMLFISYPEFIKTTGFPWLLLANFVIQGYEVTHRDIELLKLRNFTIGTKIDDTVLSSDDAQAKIKETMRGLLAFVRLPNASGYICYYLIAFISMLTVAYDRSPFSIAS